jgi:hypothetical protein
MNADFPGFGASMTAVLLKLLDWRTDKIAKALACGKPFFGYWAKDKIINAYF